MANPQHIEWLLEGVEAWNARREECNFIPDFSGADLDTTFRDAGKVNAKGRIDLNGANFRNANFNGAEIVAADFIGSDFEYADFSNSNFWYADFSNANFSHVVFNNSTNLIYSPLINVNLYDTEPWVMLLNTPQWWIDTTKLYINYNAMTITSVESAKHFIEIMKVLEKSSESDIYYNPMKYLLDLKYYFRGECENVWFLEPLTKRC